MDARLEGDRLLAFADLRTTERIAGVEAAALAIIETPAKFGATWRRDESGSFTKTSFAPTGVAYFVFELTADADILEDWFSETPEDARAVAESVHPGGPWEELPDPPEALAAIKERLQL